VNANTGGEDVDASTASEEPAERPSAMQLLADPTLFPHDSAVAAKIRLVDRYAGIAEQVVLFAMLGVVVFAGAAQAISTKLMGKSLMWSFDLVRGGTFAIALIGAAFASHQARHLSMDIVSRFISPRRRQILRIVLGLFTIFAGYLLLSSGLRLHERVAAEGGHRGLVPIETIALMIPIGSALIMFHTLLHLLIDADYLVRGKLPPEKAVTGH
jgi:TRAP-type C4-dicarboxylate transport system permease small subunit